MAKIFLTATERARLETVASELDEIVEDFFADARGSLTEEQWALLCCYANSCVRRSLEIGSLLHGVVDTQQSRAVPYKGRGREVFVREGLAAWRDSFAPLSDTWRLLTVFEAIDGGEKRVLADVATLEVMAANRMFETLDQQCASLFASDA